MTRPKLSIDSTHKFYLATPLYNNLKVKLINEANSTIEMTGTIQQEHGEDDPAFRGWSTATLTLRPLKLKVDQTTVLESNDMSLPDGIYNLRLENVQYLDEKCTDKGNNILYFCLYTLLVKL